MKIYLARHGESAPAGADNERPLSPQGIKDIHRIAAFLKPLNLRIAYLFHSVKNRAAQTAEILAPAFSFNGTPEITEELNPLSSVSPIIHEINNLDNDALFVGHMPFMSTLTSQLVTGNIVSNIIQFKTGTLICLEKSEKQWSLNWMLTPDIIQSID